MAMKINSDREYSEEICASNELSTVNGMKERTIIT